MYTPGKGLSPGLSESIYPLSSLQTKINKCIRDTIYDTLIQRIKPYLWLCAPLLKYGLQKEIRIDFFKRCCQEMCASCILGFWIFFFLQFFLSSQNNTFGNFFQITLMTMLKAIQQVLYYKGIIFPSSVILTSSKAQDCSLGPAENKYYYSFHC